MQQKGAGSFKLVYKATYNHPQAGATVVAIVRVRGSGSHGTREEVLQEIRFFKELGRHDNLLDLRGITVEPASGDYCLVTEYAPQGSLDQVLNRLYEEDSTFSPLVLLEAAMEVCNGMVHLALHGVVHRDLAVRNVLVFRWDPDDHKRGVHLKIADYGLAVMASRGNGSAQGATVSTAGSTARPIRWMAPESIARRQYTDRSDVWAFGVTMWEMWTYGQVPYGAITDDEM
eukprot:750876-Hanusia_phi.AAC.2